MAITKLMHQKACVYSSSKHLKNALYYILNPEKTEERIWTGSNVNTDPKILYKRIMDTKEAFGKDWGRQGYHFVISFQPGEADERTAAKIGGEFAERYLGDQYEYAWAVHNDKDHMHCHLVFNSVSRLDGYKFHYKKGDWKTQIQPLVDQICVKHGLQPLVYQEQKRDKHYGEWKAEKEGKPTWKRTIREDIDQAILESSSYSIFLSKMKAMGYQIREGTSKKHGKFLYLHHKDARNAKRTYSLGNGYSLESIQYRISQKYKPFQYHNPSPRIQVYAASRDPVPSSNYQLRFVRRAYWSTHRHHPMYRTKQDRKELFQIRSLTEQCRYLLQNQIDSEGALQLRKDTLKLQEQEVKRRANLYRNVHSELSPELKEEFRNLYQEKRMITRLEKSYRKDQEELHEEKIQKQQKGKKKCMIKPL